MSSTTISTDVRLLDLPTPPTLFKEVRYLVNVDQTRQTVSKVPKHPCTSTKLQATISLDEVLHQSTGLIGVSPMAPKTISLLLVPHQLLRPVSIMLMRLGQLLKRKRHLLLPPPLSLAAGPLWVVWSTIPILEP